MGGVSNEARDLSFNLFLPHYVLISLLLFWGEKSEMIYRKGSYLLILNENLFYGENLLSLFYICYLIVFVYDLSENIFKIINVMSCHKLNNQNGVDEDDLKDYNEKIMVPKHVV